MRRHAITKSATRAGAASPGANVLILSTFRLQEDPRGSIHFGAFQGSKHGARNSSPAIEADIIMNEVSVSVNFVHGTYFLRGRPTVPLLVSQLILDAVRDWPQYPTHTRWRL